MPEGPFGGPRPLASSNGSLWVGLVTDPESNRPAIERHLANVIPDTNISDIAKDPITDNSVISIDTDKHPGGEAEDLFEGMDEEKVEEAREAITQSFEDVVLAAELPRKRGGYTLDDIGDITDEVMNFNNFGGPVQVFIMAGPAVKNEGGSQGPAGLVRPFTDEKYSFWVTVLANSTEVAKEIERAVNEHEERKINPDIPEIIMPNDVIRQDNIVYVEGPTTDMLMDLIRDSVSEVKFIIRGEEREYKPEPVDIDVDLSDVEKIGLTSQDF